MSTPSRSRHRLGLAALLAATALGAAASTAHAGTSTVAATCKFPVVGVQAVPLTLTVPDEVPFDTYAEPYAISVDLPDGLAGSGSSVRAVFGSGATVTLDEPVLDQTLDARFVGTDPDIASTEAKVFFGHDGEVRVSIDALRLNLQVLSAAGTPVVMPPVRQDLDGRPVLDSDGNPDTFDAPCKIDAGQAPATFTVLPLDPTIDFTPPTLPEPVTVASVTPTSATVSWSASTDNFGVVAKYQVIVGNDVYEVLPPSTSFALTGLAPGVEHTVSILASDPTGNRSNAASVTFRTPWLPADTVRSLYDVSGQATMPTLVKTSALFRGGMSLAFNSVTGDVVGDVTFAPMTARLVSLGALPVTAKLTFSPSGRLTGTLVDGELQARVKVRIKVTEAKLFGAIPLAAGNNCQTRQLSDVGIGTFDEPFSKAAGGKVVGQFAMTDLNGCGPLNGLVDPATASEFNTLSLTVAPRVAAQ